MFQLRIITDSSKTIESIESQNQIYDTIQGKCKLYRISNDYISLTDKFELFRFLPINITNLIFIIAIPDNCLNEQFLTYTDTFLSSIKSILFISDNNNFFSCIIHFNNQDSADNYYYHFKTKAFPGNKSEFLYCVFLSKIIFSNSNIENSNNSLSEIPLCPLCIENIESSNLGIETMLNIFPCERWTNYKKNCLICKNFSSKNNNNYKCVDCENTNNLWCCLICGYIGCNRYQEKHSLIHSKKYNHRYSIELNNQRIWDYMTDSWVHRIIKNNENNIIFDENLDNEMDREENTKVFLKRMENVMSEYSEVLSNQLELQRKYYELQCEKLEMKYNNNLQENKKILTNLKDDINKKKYKIKLNDKLDKDCKKKKINFDKKIKEFQDTINFNKECIKDLIEDNKVENQKKIIDNEKEKLKEELIRKQERKKNLQKEVEEIYNQL